MYNVPWLQEEPEIRGIIRPLAANCQVYRIVRSIVRSMYCIILCTVLYHALSNKTKAYLYGRLFGCSAAVMYNA